MYRLIFLIITINILCISLFNKAEYLIYKNYYNIIFSVDSKTINNVLLIQYGDTIKNIFIIFILNVLLKIILILFFPIIPLLILLTRIGINYLTNIILEHQKLLE